jgi:ABC-type polysaccharide/polyol phosphate transport system ATPase subunit
MPEPSIQFDAVRRKFHRGEHHDTVRDVLRAVSRRARRQVNGQDPDEFWAVRDVSFEVRIGALIEVSAGLHQDITGRENIFLQGVLMGMQQPTIKETFDQIADFSGIAEFLDTPVKRYSSGMNARLGFAIAVHLDPDVLIIDEVLSVGAFRCQQRAYARFQELARSGRPVVVVSCPTSSMASRSCVRRPRCSSRPRPYRWQCRRVHHGLSRACRCFGAGSLGPSTPGVNHVRRAERQSRDTPPRRERIPFTVTVECQSALAPFTTLGVRYGTWLTNRSCSRRPRHGRRFRCRRARSSRSRFTPTMRAHLIRGHYVIEAYAFDQKRGGELC